MDSGDTDCDRNSATYISFRLCQISFRYAASMASKKENDYSQKVVKDARKFLCVGVCLFYIKNVGIQRKVSVEIRKINSTNNSIHALHLQAEGSKQDARLLTHDLREGIEVGFGNLQAVQILSSWVGLHSTHPASLYRNRK